jgi:hypothetical protein
VTLVHASQEYSYIFPKFILKNKKLYQGGLGRGGMEFFQFLTGKLLLI